MHKQTGHAAVICDHISAEILRAISMMMVMMMKEESSTV
jgi:hypothetical protein